MNHLLLVTSSRKVCPWRHMVLRLTSNSSKDGAREQKSSSTRIPDLNKLQRILSDMKVKKMKPSYLNKIEPLGNSDLFNYATNKKYNQEELQTQQSETWKRLYQYELDNSYIRLPFNGIEEMILLTEQGKLWKYPIDNEQGMDEEKQVPFEDHVFLEPLLEDFPKHDYIQQFMGYICSGLAKNHYMTVARKREIIKFYKDYFEEHKELYKTSGLDM